MTHKLLDEENKGSSEMLKINLLSSVLIDINQISFTFKKINQLSNSATSQ